MEEHKLGRGIKCLLIKFFLHKKLFIEITMISYWSQFEFYFCGVPVAWTPSTHSQWDWVDNFVLKKNFCFIFGFPWMLPPATLKEF